MWTKISGLSITDVKAHQAVHVTVENKTHMGRERVFSEKKSSITYFRQAFWYGKGVRYHRKIFQNRDIGGF